MNFKEAFLELKYNTNQADPNGVKAVCLAVNFQDQSRSFFNPDDFIDRKFIIFQLKYNHDTGVYSFYKNESYFDDPKSMIKTEFHSISVDKVLSFINDLEKKLVNFNFYNEREDMVYLPPEQYLPILFPKVEISGNFILLKKEIFKLNHGFDIDEMYETLLKPIVAEMCSEFNLTIEDLKKCENSWCLNCTNIQRAFLFVASKNPELKQYNKIWYSPVLKQFYLETE